jgi:hypothetical protein
MTRYVVPSGYAFWLLWTCIWVMEMHTSLWLDPCFSVSWYFKPWACRHLDAFYWLLSCVPLVLIVLLGEEIFYRNRMYANGQ